MTRVMQPPAIRLSLWPCVWLFDRSRNAGAPPSAGLGRYNKPQLDDASSIRWIGRWAGSPGLGCV